MRRLLPLVLLLGPVAMAQVDLPVFGKQQVINGYEKDIEGEVISYFSVYPEYATDALLTRCTDGKKAIAWETAAVPKDQKGDFAYFSWIAAHSSTTSSGDRNFDLYVNDAKVLTFTTHHSTQPATWSADGVDGVKLVFEFSKMDRHGDAHGFAHLRVPRKYLTPGKPLRLKIVGQAQDSPDWFMTFRYSFEEKVVIEALPFLNRGGNMMSQPLQLTVMHFGAPQKLKVKVDDFPKPEEFIVNNGLNAISINALVPREPMTAHLIIDVGNVLHVDTVVTLPPVIPRDIYLVHHSHNDIGYSNLQTEVVKIQNKNIYDALDLIDRTKDYPPDSRFVWNIESLWAVENFLGVASETDKQRFIAAVKSGSIALSANYANILTGLCTPEEMDWIVEYADSLRKWYGVPINTAMQTDIPGMSWSMVDAYSSNGVRYLSQGPNYMPDLPDGGDRIGGTLHEQGDKPYWWKGTTGRDSILVWTAGHGYSDWHGFTPGAIKERGTRKFAAYMDSLAARGYPYDMVQWRYNIVSDNGPVDSTISDFVRDWNERYSSPHLILANVNDMMERFEEKYGKQIPTWSGDFTPYWEDGAYSTAKEEGDVRILSAQLSNLIDAAMILKKPIDPHLVYRAQRSIVMWHEHTWGAWNSISDPDDPEVIAQWKYKKAFADSAGWYVDAIGKSIGAKPEKLIGYSLDALPPRYPWMFVEGLDPRSARSQYGSGLVEDDQETGYKHVNYQVEADGKRDKQSQHLELPFNIPNAAVRIGISDTCVTPESGRIPGSNNDFFSVQRWIDVSNDTMGVTIVCPQGALWEVGDMVDERKTEPGKGSDPQLYKAWKTEAHSSSTIYLYALNNYWHTNFKADQEGPITYDIYLKMHGPFKLEDARRFGLEMTRPLITWWK